MNSKETKWLEYLNQKLADNSISEKEKAYLSRIWRVLKNKDLSRSEWNPVQIVIDKIVKSDYYAWFDTPKVPEIVSEWETFDLFNFLCSVFFLWSGHFFKISRM